jgi:SEC-C motif domain protein
MNPELCPCGSGEPYASCCGRYLSGEARPETAEQLMRSRYTAYVRGDEAYLLATWHSSTRPRSLGLAASAQLKWLGLKVRGTEAGGPGDAAGTVSFVARHKRGGRALRLEETSRFVREAGRWVYLDGDVAP